MFRTGLVIVALLLGCDPEKKPDWAGRTDERAAPEGVHTVDVVVRNGAIEMPTTLPAGPVALRIDNTSDTDHVLRLVGPGVDTDEQIRPRRTEPDTIVADLQPGRYELSCTVADHADQGERVVLTVSGTEQVTERRAP